MNFGSRPHLHPHVTGQSRIAPRPICESSFDASPVVATPEAVGAAVDGSTPRTLSVPGRGATAEKDVTPHTLSCRMLVESVMTTSVETIDADAAVMTALDEMLDREVGSLVVTTGTPPRKAGIVTDSDVKSALHDFEHPLEDTTVVDRIVFLLRRPVTGAPVREYMSTPLVTIGPDASLSEAIGMMNDHDIKHLVVTEQMNLEGILTASDVGRVHDDVVSDARRSDARRPHWER